MKYPTLLRTIYCFSQAPHPFYMSFRIVKEMTDFSTPELYFSSLPGSTARLVPPPPPRGSLHFVRLVKENGNINILNEDFYVGKNLSFQYVWAIISTKDHNVRIWYQPTKDAPKELIKTKFYKLREPVKNRIPINKFC